MKSATSTPITVIGSINTDMVVKAADLPKPGQTVIGGEFFMSAGGKGGNQAVAAARLGAAVAMVANVGTDMLGDAALQRLESEGVACHMINRDAQCASGVALISVDKRGENHIVVAPGANNELYSWHIDAAFDHIADGSLVLLQLEIPLDTVARAIAVAQTKHCRVILDPAPAQALPESLLASVYLLTPNQSEAEILTGIEVVDEATASRAAAQLVGQGVENVALTMGNGGVLLADAGGCELIPAESVSAIDSTAAGDCFNGALASALASGESLAASAAFACRAAAIAVTRLGAQDAMPFEHELTNRVS